jgi:hypothetical protein
MSSVSTALELLLGGTLAIVQPASQATPSAASVVDGPFLAAFVGTCMENGSPPAGFEPSAWSDFPEALRLMNTYNHGGTFLRGSIADRTAYVARTRGEAHLNPGIETRCGIALQGASYDHLVTALAARLGVEPVDPIEVNGVRSTMLVSRAGMVTVTSTTDDWIILRNMGIMIAVPRR